MERMIWNPWTPTPVTRGRPFTVRSDRAPILMGPIPKVHFNLQDDSGTTTAAAAAPSQETTSRETTQSVAERTRVRPAETEAEGAPQVQRTRTAVSVPGTATTGMTSETTTTSPARALVERVGNEAGEDSQPVQMRQIVALLAECEDTTASEAVAEARQKKLGKIHQCQSPRRSHQSRASHRRDHQTLDRTMGGQCAR